MTRILRLLISQTPHRVVFLVLWLILFAATVTISGTITSQQVAGSMRAQAGLALEQYTTLRASLSDVFDTLDATATAEPCSDTFRDQVRRVAFLPDGLNEFLYIRDGMALCSANVGRFATPVMLGEPDVTSAAAGGLASWIDRGLGFVGLEGLAGSITSRGHFAVIVPQHEPPVVRWMDEEVVRIGENGKLFHRAGPAGIYDDVLKSGVGGGILPPTSGVFRQLVCDDQGQICVAARANVANLFIFGWSAVVIGVIFAALVSSWLASRLHNMLRHYWDMESRFRRHLDADTIVCVYQPIIDVRDNSVVGCEVLARWRDVDGAIVMPDRFLPVVERHGLTMEFTRLVIARAAADLAQLPSGRTLDVFFNIFPRDLDTVSLRDAFEPFDALRNRFEIVVELVESDEVETIRAQREIEELRRFGIRTYIDDFGTGYSNIQHLAELAVDGVKLDRIFAMSDDGSLMARMLPNVIGMVHTSGRAILIEGIESRERLDSVRATEAVDYAQGYFISRPLDIRNLAKFLVSPREHLKATTPAARRGSRLATAS